MNDQIREQISAFLDGELPNSETELLLKRLTRDAELRDSFGRYALYGECLRGATHAGLSRGFTGRVNRSIDGEPSISTPQKAVAVRAAAWWRPFAGAAVAAGVAAVAVVALQQRAIAPTLHDALPLTAQNGGSIRNSGLVKNAAMAVQSDGGGLPKEALSYTVPATVADAPAALPAARLTNYVFAHSKYSSVLGQNDVLNDLLSAPEAGANDGPMQRPPEMRVAP